MIKNGNDYFLGISSVLITLLFFFKGLKAEFDNDDICFIKLNKE